MFTAYQWIWSMHLLYTVAVLTLLIHSILSAQVKHNTGQNIYFFAPIGNILQHVAWLVWIVIYYLNPIDIVLHMGLFFCAYLATPTHTHDQPAQRSAVLTIRHAVVLTHLLIINHPTNPSLISVFFFIEASSTVSLAYFVWILYTLPTKRGLGTTLIPFTVFNFLTYLVLFKLVILTLNFPCDNAKVHAAANLLGSLYTLLKLGVAPALFTKAAVYARINSAQVVALALPLVFVTFPNITYLHTYVLLTDVTQLLTTTALVMGVTGVGTLLVQTHTQALLISTPLFLITLTINSLQI